MGAFFAREVVLHCYRWARNSVLDHTQVTFSDKEKIEILFKEYDTLRTEIVGRSADKNQLMAVGGVVFAGILAWGPTHPPNWIFWAAIALASGVVINMTRISYRDIYFVSDRIAEIEEAIDKLCGAELLIWESKIAMGAKKRAKRRRLVRPPS